VDPLPLAPPLDEPGIAQDLQVPGDARLALLQRLRHVRDTERGLGTQSEQPQPAGLTGRPEPSEENGRRQSHLKDCTSPLMTCQTGCLRT